MPRNHAAALALAAIPAATLISGLIAFALSHLALVPWIFAAGIIPVLAVLLVTIIQSLRRGEIGVNIIAALSMLGALLAGENLAGVVIALMYSGGMLLEDYAQRRAQHEMGLASNAKNSPAITSIDLGMEGYWGLTFSTAETCRMLDFIKVRTR